MENLGQCLSTGLSPVLHLICLTHPCLPVVRLCQQQQHRHLRLSCRMSPRHLRPPRIKMLYGRLQLSRRPTLRRWPHASGVLFVHQQDFHLELSATCAFVVVIFTVAHFLAPPFFFAARWTSTFSFALRLLIQFVGGSAVWTMKSSFYFLFGALLAPTGVFLGRVLLFCATFTTYASMNRYRCLLKTSVFHSRGSPHRRQGIKRNIFYSRTVWLLFLLLSRVSLYVTLSNCLYIVLFFLIVPLPENWGGPM